MVDPHHWEVVRQALEHSAQLGDHVEHVLARVADQVASLKNSVDPEMVKVAKEAALDLVEHVAEGHKVAHEGRPFMNRAAVGAAVQHAAHELREGIADLVGTVSETLRPTAQTPQDVAANTQRFIAPESIAPSALPSHGISDLFNQAAAPSSEASQASKQGAESLTDQFNAAATAKR